MINITCSLWLATPECLADLGTRDIDEQPTVHEMVLQHILIPSENYMCHLCVNRYSIIDGEQSSGFMLLLAYLLRISPFYQPTMKSVLQMPVFLAIPSCLTFFDNHSSISWFVRNMINAQREWNDKRGDQRQMWKTVHRMLRLEGVGDVIEEKLQNDQNGSDGRDLVDELIRWNSMLDMNLPEQE
ncbi:hypothetical protein BLNAU_14387 [Blattamonas nauphoetae]|uniref:Uncharacterized protein n=1 Tax=Blattamonas nauphoetae TaxID=2049346 RepID=A0ABQ9XFJ4_9EUKA|nr:hypothetical protein BLNAU_14387 [Blattamonas nauphoetae]